MGGYWVSIILQAIIIIILITIIIIAPMFITSSSSSSSSSEVEPTPESNSSRFSIEGGRKGILRLPFPTELRGYTINGTTTGIYEDWSTSSSSLGAICDKIGIALMYSFNNPNSRDGKLTRLIAEDFILRYCARLKEVGIQAKTLPWGNNWYEFSVSSTMMLAYYLLLQNPSLADVASDTILMLITNPTTSLGWYRDGPNAVYITGPYLLAKYYKGEVEEVFTTSEYKLIEKTIALPIERAQGIDGLHLDNTYLYHGGLVGFSYLTTLMSRLTSYFYGLDTQLDNVLVEKLDVIRSYVYHPTIPISSLGQTGRLNSLSIATYPTSPLGIKVFPFQRYIRYFTSKYQFSMRGQVPWLFYFEADKTNYKQSMYWVQFRNVNTINTSPDLQFPDAGFICGSDVTNLIETPSLSSSTYGYKTSSADSFVLAYERYGVLWQQYKIEEFGSQQVTELVVIDSKNDTITIDLIIESSTSTVYYSSLSEVSIEEYRNKVSPLPVSTKTHYRTKFDLNKGTVQTTQISNLSDLLPLTLEDGISVSRTTNYNILSVNNKAKVLALKSVTYEVDNVMADDGTFFSFDKENNQYISQ